MTRQRLREARSWPFAVLVLALGLVLLAGTLVAVWRGGIDRYLVLAFLACVPLITVVSRFPMILERAEGWSIEIGFDSSILMFLLCTLPAREAVAVWSAGVAVTQLVSGKRIVAQTFNIGLGILAGGAAAAMVARLGTDDLATLREVAAVAAGAATYFAFDYLLSAVMMAVDSRSGLGENLQRRGALLAVGCFVALDMLGYLGATVLRYSPWWPVTLLLLIPLGTLLVATRAVARGTENERRLRALLDGAVRLQTVYDRAQVEETLIEEAGSLLRLPQVGLRTTPPERHEIGAQVVQGKRPLWVVAPAAVRARSTTQADERALAALAAVAADALARLKLTEDMVHYARHDPLTDLPNRGILQDRVTHALSLARRHGEPLALLFVDLDGFKPVNDRWGHAAGDRVLQQVADRMRACVRDSDTVARLGGDEFAVLFENVGAEHASELAGRILDSIGTGVEVEGQRVPLGASIGLALSHEGVTTEGLLREADLAMYEAKSLGKAQVVTYVEAMGSTRLEKLELVEELRRAVAADAIEVVYQPVVGVATGTVSGVEALARWRVGDRMVPPDVFIRLAEETGQIVALGEGVLATAAADAHRLRTSPGGADLVMSVNVSAPQLRDPGFVDAVRRAVATIGGPFLVLEITEREGIGEDAQVLRTMRRICDLGVRFAIDDFGAGFASIGYLQDVPVHIIKADAGLSRRIDSDERSRSLLRAVVRMGSDLGMDVVVEGVEREEQLAVLRDHVQARFAQGYLLHRPMPINDLLTVLQGLAEADRAGEQGAHGTQAAPATRPAGWIIATSPG